MASLRYLTTQSSLFLYMLVVGIATICALFTFSMFFQERNKPPLFRNNSTRLIDQRFENSFPKSKSFACNSTHINQFNINLNDSSDVYRQKYFEQYCNILPVPLHKWNGAKTYTERDIAFVIFTGLPFYRNRALAMYDTWLSRTTKYYFLSATPDYYLPVTIVMGAGEDKLSNIKKLFYGLQIIYKQQMLLSPNDRQKWFYIAGCDTFIFVPHLLKRLDGYNHTEALLIGSDIGIERCPGENNTTFSIPFPSGGAGFFFSFKLLEIMQPHLSNYLENIWFPGSPLSDVALTCLAYRLGVKLTDASGFWRDTPIKTLNEHGYNKLHSDSEINSFHYVPSEEMYALDEFYVLQHVERLIKHGNINDLSQLINHFIVTHYKLMRMKKEKCILPLFANTTISES